MDSSSPVADMLLPPEPVLAQLRARDERLGALKALAGTMAHDFNNFLVPLLGYVSLAREELPDESAASHYLRAMEENARKTEEALEAMLLAMRPQRRVSPKQIDLRRIAEAELAALEANFAKGAGVEIEADLEAVSLMADEGHWTQLFRQLFQNARFALALGGRLKVEVRRVRASEGQARALGSSQCDFFRITVEDTGIGMPAPAVERAFEPFFTTRAKGQALGLGLTIVHSVAHFHGGQVLLESDEERGTRVRVWAPMAGISKKAERPAAAAPAGKAAPAKVLLVEDDPLVREVVKTYLQRIPVEVAVARDGAEGLRLFEKLRSELGLVLSDITMPNMDGIELFLRIKQIDPEARMMLMSGNVAAMEEASLSRLGENRPVLLKKPFTLKTFLQVIRTQLGSDV